MCVKLSEHFKDPHQYMLVKLIEPNSYTFDNDIVDFRLIDLYKNDSVFLFYISWQNHIIKTNSNWTYDKETLFINNILQRERV